MRQHSFTRSILLLCLLAPAGARAADPPPQLVAIDVTYEANSMTTHEAHYDVMPRADQPANWKSPIDYTAGTAYIHLEVMTKPSDLPTQIDVCFDGDLEGYGCLSTDLYTTTGVHETVAKLSTMWQFDKVAWTKKRTLYQLVVKDKDNNNGGKPPASFLPTKLRMVFTIVPPGGTYVPPAGAMAPATDGGAAMADAGAPEDAMAAADAEAMEPPVTTPDAAAPVTTKDAAASTPPTTTPPTGGDTTPPAGDDTPPPKKATRAGGSCAMANGEPGLLVMVGLAISMLARRRRR